MLVQHAAYTVILPAASVTVLPSGLLGRGLWCGCR